MRCRQEKKKNAGLAKIKYFSVEHLPRGTLDSYLHLYIITTVVHLMLVNLSQIKLNLVNI